MLQLAERQYRTPPTRPDVQECNVSSVSAGCSGVADDLQLLARLYPSCHPRMTAQAK
jgi:hypothetical protein